MQLLSEILNVLSSIISLIVSARAIYKSKDDKKPPRK